LNWTIGTKNSHEQIHIYLLSGKKNIPTVQCSGIRGMGFEFEYLCEVKIIFNL
jgi:hypothetical protein